MSHLDPYNASGWTTLHSLVQSLARPFADTGQPNNPAANSQREEPTFPPDPRITAAGESAVDAALDKEMTNQWSQRMKEARDKKAAPARADKAATQAWIDKMRAAREGKKAKPPDPNDPGRKKMEDALRGAQEALAARGQGETSKATGAPDKPPPPSWYDPNGRFPPTAQQLIGQVPFIPDENGFKTPMPPISWDNLETFLRTGRTDTPPSWYDPQEREQQGVLGRDPLAPIGEDAVAKALRDIDMKPLIDHALMVQEAMRRRDAIRQMIESMQTPQLPESQIPENTNRPPGSPHSEVTAHDYSLLPPLAPGVEGIGMPPLAAPQPRLPANTNFPLFPPQGPHDPNLPPGPHVRSPGKPEDEPPVVE